MTNANNGEAKLDEIVEQAIAIVAQYTQTHDDAVQRFYMHRTEESLHPENRIIAKMVDQVILRLRAESELVSLRTRNEELEARDKLMHRVAWKLANKIDAAANPNHPCPNPDGCCDPGYIVEETIREVEKEGHVLYGEQSFQEFLAEARGKSWQSLEAELALMRQPLGNEEWEALRERLWYYRSVETSWIDGMRGIIDALIAARSVKEAPDGK
jgi:hypothetical protein